MFSIKYCRQLVADYYKNCTFLYSNSSGIQRAVRRNYKMYLVKIFIKFHRHCFHRFPRTSSCSGCGRDRDICWLLTWRGRWYYCAIRQSNILPAWRHPLQLVHKIIFRDWFWEGIYADIPPSLRPCARHPTYRRHIRHPAPLKSLTFWRYTNQIIIIIIISLPHDWLSRV